MGAANSSMEDYTGSPSEVCAALFKEVDTLKEFTASRDADDIAEACGGVGTDEAALVSILCNRTKAQLKRVDVAVHAKMGKSLQQVCARAHAMLAIACCARRSPLF
jgi:Annexin